jgi:hypothetical protein
MLRVAVGVKNRYNPIAVSSITYSTNEDADLLRHLARASARHSVAGVHRAQTFFGCRAKQTPPVGRRLTPNLRFPFGEPSSPPPAM